MTRGATRGATVGLGTDAPAAAIDHVACMSVLAASSRASPWIGALDHTQARAELASFEMSTSHNAQGKSSRAR